MPPIDCVVCSPPYAECLSTDGRDRNAYINEQIKAGKMTGRPCGKDYTLPQPYGCTPGQLGAMPPGRIEDAMNLDGVISSPPYAGIGMSEASPTIGTPPRPGDVRQYRRKAPIREYGITEGQLGAMPPGRIEDAMTTRAAVPVVTWEGCYDSGWKGICVSAAFSHPAKFARGLAERIVDFMIAKMWLRPGMTVLDPFAGVGLGGIVCASRGYRWVGVELEPRFYRMANGYNCPGLSKDQWVRWHGRYSRNPDLCHDCQKLTGAAGYVPHSGRIPEVPPHRFRGNFDLHRRKWEQFGDPLPCIIQGDSRRLSAVLREAGAVLSSPPYAHSKPDHWEAADNERYNQLVKEGKVTGKPRGKNAAISEPTYYGTTPGQLGAMPPGSVEAVVSSPPYEGSIDKRQDRECHRAHRAAIGRDPDSPASIGIQGYGTTPGNLGNLPPGSVEGVVSSPPYAESPIASIGGGQGEAYRHTGKSPRARRDLVNENYADTPGQLGSESVETFWSAAAQILRETHALLRPGAVTAWVCKMFVRDKKLVDFPGDWARLLAATGFEVFLEVRASMVKTDRHPGLFGESVKTKKKASFFRRLTEKKGSPEINWETVLFARRLP